MATRLYFHDASYSLASPPLSRQSNFGVTINATGASTIRAMNRDIGTSQASIAITTANNQTSQMAHLRMFSSPPLVDNTTINTSNITVNVADAQSNANCNFYVNGICLYVWIPSTGSRRGSVMLVESASTSYGAVAPSINTPSVTTWTIPLVNSISAQAGDVIICEIYSTFTQTMSTAYTGTMYYDGTTVTTTENTTTTSHASYIEFVQDLVLVGDPFLQTLTQDTRFNNTDVEYAPTVTTLTNLIQFSLYTNTNNFYSATITQTSNRYAYPISDVSVGAWYIPVTTTRFTNNGTSTLLGAASLTASTTPTSGTNDDGYWTISLPFNITFNGTSYSTIYVGTNAYITFGSGSSVYQTLSDSNPALVKLRIADGDRSCQRLYYGQEGSTYRIRFEGSTSASGTLGSPTLVYELILSQTSPSVMILNYGNTGGTGNLRACTGSALIEASTTSSANTSYTYDDTPSPDITVDIYQAIDENSPGSDTDYIKTTVSGSVYSVNLSSVPDPLTSSEQIVRYRLRSSTNNSATVTLKQGTTTIATRTHTQVPSTWTEYNMYLSVAECNAITNYSALKVEIYST